MKEALVYMDELVKSRVRGGAWELSSESDPLWNCHGHVDRMIITDGYPQEVKDKLAELEAKYGSPPDDLTYSCMKD